eukprot:GHVN01026247.1.p1 GENE.GHVN01026247.1~~GHVN01026247.1.p1  ORF type:complete len:196 (+),score=24.34 GHVN01026247.1:56-643(+)
MFGSASTRAYQALLRPTLLKHSLAVIPVRRHLGRYFATTPPDPKHDNSTSTTNSGTSSPKLGEDHNSPHVSFGERTVNRDEKTKLVGEVFSSVADKYDLMNDLMSCMMHRMWKNRLVDSVDLPFGYGSRREGYHILDVGGGTGDIAFRIIEKAKSNFKFDLMSAYRLPKITVSDINNDMLEVGRKRAKASGLGGK